MIVALGFRAGPFIWSRYVLTCDRPRVRTPNQPDLSFYFYSYLLVSSGRSQFRFHAGKVPFVVVVEWRALELGRSYQERPSS